MNIYLEVSLFFIIAITFIVLNGVYRCSVNHGKDWMMTKIADGYDYWSISHFVLFFLIGIWVRKRHRIDNNIILFILGCGILWELIEHWLGKNRPSWIGGFSDCTLTTDDLESTHKDWWYGRETDIIMNTAGLLVGSWL